MGNINIKNRIVFLFICSLLLSGCNSRQEKRMNVEKEFEKSWIDGKYEFQETTPILRAKKSLFHRYIKAIIDKFGLPFNDKVLLLTQNDTSYVFDNGDLTFITKCGGLSTINLSDPMYNQMIKYENVGFIRSGANIYLSIDNLKKWKNIYTGSRQIKESMYYNSVDSTLIFTQYTPR